MSIRQPGAGQGRPSDELRHFTDREDVQAVFARLLNLPAPTPLPALMYYGVGGMGKSWLLKRLRAGLREGSDLPSAFIDFDSAVDGSQFREAGNLLAEVWRQFDVDCPRFELAYSMMRFKQGAGDRPLRRGGGKSSSAWEFCQAGGQDILNGVPGGNLIAWAANKLGGAAGKKLEGTALGGLLNTDLGDFLKTDAGKEEYQALARMTAQEILPLLAGKLGQDLEEKLPTRPGKSCRAVIFLDTFECVRVGVLGDAQQQVAEKPVRDLFAHLPSTLLVIAGRDRLTWHEVDAEWEDPGNLEQHLLGGLSRHDAAAFLEKCGVEPGRLQEALLRVSVDTGGKGHEVDYYPFSLGLCADTVVAERAAGREPDPATFDMAPGDFDRLAHRFLKSLHDHHTELWITALAQTPRFDEAAARDAFSPTRDVQQDAAWDILRDYSFVQKATEPGWYRLHSLMATALNERLAKSPEPFEQAHRLWKDYWQSRSGGTTDELASLAWYHEYSLDPGQGRQSWNERIKEARRSAQMSVHYRLLDWWSATGIERSSPSSLAEAIALVVLGNELYNASLGERVANLRSAITCYESALIVYNHDEFPFQWSGIQNNLGIVYNDLHSGDREANLRFAIACFESALTIWTRDDFPSDWAMAQNNLGIAYRNLRSGDLEANLRRAIACFESALTVQTRRQLSGRNGRRS